MLPSCTGLKLTNKPVPFPSLWLETTVPPPPSGLELGRCPAQCLSHHVGSTDGSPSHDRSSQAPSLSSFSLTSHLGFISHFWHLLLQNLTPLASKNTAPALSCNPNCSPTPGLDSASGEIITRVLHPTYTSNEATSELGDSRGKENVSGKTCSFYLKIIYNLLSLHKCFKILFFF